MEKNPPETSPAYWADFRRSVSQEEELRGPRPTEKKQALWGSVESASDRGVSGARAAAQ